MRLNPSMGGVITFAIGVLTLFSSCSPSAVNTEKPNALVAQPDTLRLISLLDVQHTTLALNCGCTFPLQIQPANGDTAIILYQAVEPLGDTVTPHTINFSAAPGTPSGHYEANFSFATYDAYTRANFYDTVHVILQF